MHSGLLTTILPSARAIIEFEHFSQESPFIGDMGHLEVAPLSKPKISVIVITFLAIDIWIWIELPVSL